MTQAAPEASFFGQPKGLGFLVGAEAWERFSYYGMQTLLVLYMGRFLLLPGHVEHVAGFTTFRAVITQVYGPLSPAALASVVFGLYAGGVYLTPLAGGFIADRLLGRTPTIVIGAGLMAIGHFLMAFEAPFLVALACLLAGVGCFKGNIASQLGELYEPGDLRRAGAFQVFVIGINVAAIASPLVCGTLGQDVAWRWGFAAAGVGMLIGAAVYLSGRRFLPAQAPIGGAHPHRPKLVKGEGRAILVLIALLPALALVMVGNQEISNAYMVWGDAHYDLVFFGHAMPVTWLVSLDAFVGVGTLFLTVGFWRWWARRWAEPDETIKLVIGAIFLTAAPLMLVLAGVQEQATGHKTGLGWGIAFHLINDVGFSNFYPVGLALFSRAAPRAVAGLMLGVFYLHLFVTNMIVGRIGGLLEQMTPVSFWLMHVALVGAGAGLLLILSLAFGRILAPATGPEASRPCADIGPAL